MGKLGKQSEALLRLEKAVTDADLDGIDAAIKDCEKMGLGDEEVVQVRRGGPYAWGLVALPCTRVVCVLRRTPRTPRRRSSSRAPPRRTWRRPSRSARARASRRPLQRLRRATSASGACAEQGLSRVEQRSPDPSFPPLCRRRSHPELVEKATRLLELLDQEDSFIKQLRTLGDNADEEGLVSSNPAALRFGQLLTPPPPPLRAGRAH